MKAVNSDASYSIAAVSRLTGVSCHALRVWERRYGFPVPGRSPSGHRRFSSNQVATIRKVAELSRGGESLTAIMESVRAGTICIEPSVEETPIVGHPSSDGVDHLLNTLIAGDSLHAEELFERLVHGLSPLEQVTQVIEPSLTEIGDRWFRKQCSIFQERTVTSLLRRKLDLLLNSVISRNVNPTRSALIGTVQGDRHHGGVMMLSILLEDLGWRAIELGVDLPVSEYQRAAVELKPNAILLSFVLSRNINKRFKELSQIRDVPIFVGGRSILNYQGLARKHNLIPLCKPLPESIQEFQREMDVRSQVKRG